MLYPTSYLKSKGLGKVCALITDGRFSGGSSGLSIGHVSPEAAEGGLIGLVEEGDRIKIDIPARSISLVVDDTILAQRREAMLARGAEAWKPAEAKPQGVDGAEGLCRADDQRRPWRGARRSGVRCACRMGGAKRYPSCSALEIDGFRFALPILRRTIADLRQHLDAAERGHAAALEHHDLRRQLTQFGGVVADIDHRNAFVAQPHQIGQDFLLAALVERSQRLVQQQQARL